MKTLVIDIETAPNVSHTWGLWQQNVGLPQLIESGYVLCFAAKWTDREKVMFHKGPKMIAAAHKLLSDADAVVHYNGNSFDIPWLQSEMVRQQMTPPSPWQNIDLLRVVRRQFRFPSNKLDYVAGELLGEHKEATGGHATWIGCMAGDRKAWALMEQYNRADVELTERLFNVLKPWIRQLPNPALYGDADVAEHTCPQCGSDNISKRGLAYTALSSYQRYQCNECQRWSRGKHRVHSIGAR